MCRSNPDSRCASDANNRYSHSTPYCSWAIRRYIACGARPARGSVRKWLYSHSNLSVLNRYNWSRRLWLYVRSNAAVLERNEAGNQSSRSATSLHYGAAHDWQQPEVLLLSRWYRWPADVEIIAVESAGKRIAVIVGLGIVACEIIRDTVLLLGCIKAGVRCSERKCLFVTLEVQYFHKDKKPVLQT